MVKRYENHGDPRLPLGLFVHESDYEALAARLAEAERDAARYRWLKTERGAAAHEWWIGLPDDEQDAFIDERLAVSAEPARKLCDHGDVPMHQYDRCETYPACDCGRRDAATVSASSASGVQE